MPLRPDMEASDYLDILRRRKWYIVFSILIILFGASVFCVVAPEKYKSSTTILVVPQRVPEGYVRSTISSRVDERLFTIRQQVLSRTRLLAVMEELGLYREERKRLPVEEVVETMRKSIDIQVASATDRSGRRRDSNEDAFTLTVTHSNPSLAMMAASRLASYFIDENLKSREQQAVGTSEFLESQLQETKARLEAQEEKVKQYKLKFMGELPQQLQANLQILSRLQDQLKMNSDAIRTAQDRKVYLEAQIGVLESQLNAIAAQMTAAEKAVREAASGGSETPLPSILPSAAIANELAGKRSQLAALSTKYTERYPEIRRLKDEVAQLEKRLAEAIAAEGSAGNTHVPTRLNDPRGGGTDRQAPGARERDEILRLRAQGKALDSEIASLRKDRQGIERSIASLEARIEKSPKREQEMVSLTRDYENLKASYDDLLKKKLDADVSQNLEKRQKGEQFQILDPANLPQEPYSPDRKKVFGIAFASAMLIGFGGAFGFEMINPTLRGKRDFQHFFQVPVLASIPVIRDTAYEAKRQRQRTFLYGGMISFGALVTGFLVLFGQKVRTLLLGMLS
jgi:polysaccharide chain length determinant protein (PEP-CTERM system associated)